MTQEKVFADGFSFRRNEKAPNFVVGNLSIKADEAIQFINSHKREGWVNLSIKYGRSGNPYIELDTFVPKSDAAETDPIMVEEEDDDVPF
jgi:hypothetical protein